MNNIDIVDVKMQIREGMLRVDIYGDNILLRDTITGEAVKIANHGLKQEIHATWRGGVYAYECSNCSIRAPNDGEEKTPYCPYCGAHMEL